MNMNMSNFHPQHQSVTRQNIMSLSPRPKSSMFIPHHPEKVLFPVSDLTSTILDTLSSSISSEIYHDILLSYFSRQQNIPRPKCQETLFSNQNEISLNSRAILVDWMFDVADDTCLLRETVYKAISLVDIYTTLTANIPLSEYQLLGACCLSISSKISEQIEFTLLTWVKSTDFAFSEHVIKAMELKVLNTLSFQINPPTSHLFFTVWIEALAKCLPLAILEPQSISLSDFLSNQFDYVESLVSLSEIEFEQSLSESITFPALFQHQSTSTQNSVDNVHNHLLANKNKSLSYNTQRMTNAINSNNSTMQFGLNNVYVPAKNLTTLTTPTKATVGEPKSNYLKDFTNSTSLNTSNSLHFVGNNKTETETSSDAHGATPDTVDTENILPSNPQLRYRPTNNTSLSFNSSTSPIPPSSIQTPENSEPSQNFPRHVPKLQASVDSYRIATKVKLNTINAGQKISKPLVNHFVPRCSQVSHSEASFLKSIRKKHRAVPMQSQRITPSLAEWDIDQKPMSNPVDSPSFPTALYIRAHFYLDACILSPESRNFLPSELAAALFALFFPSFTTFFTGYTLYDLKPVIQFIHRFAKHIAIPKYSNYLQSRIYRGIFADEEFLIQIHNQSLLETFLSLNKVNENGFCGGSKQQQKVSSLPKVTVNSPKIHLHQHDTSPNSNAISHKISNVNTSISPKYHHYTNNVSLNPSSLSPVREKRHRSSNIPPSPITDIDLHKISYPALPDLPFVPRKRKKTNRYYSI